MLQSLQWAALGTGFTFLMTTLGAATVFFLSGEPKPRFQKAMLGFAAGVMTAASVWSLLLPAIDQAEGEGRFPGWLPAAAGMLLGVVFLLVIVSQFAPRLHLARGIGTAFILLFALLNFADVDARMAAYNVEHYRSGDLQEIDTAHLRGLAEAAIPAAYPLLQDKEASVAQAVRQWYRDVEVALENRSPMEWSLAAYRAEEAIRLARRDHLLDDGAEILTPPTGDGPVDEVDVWQAEVGFQQGIDDQWA